MDLRSPSSEYRPAPFWSWNDTLTDEELRWQVRELKRAGYGGFFMHPRVGLETEYLSSEWFDRIGACVDEARQCDMQAWLYDEDKWPSGFAGGWLARKHPETVGVKLAGEEIASDQLETALCDTDTVAVFAIGNNGTAVNARRLVSGDQLNSEETAFRFRIQPFEKLNWFNGEAYLDMLNPDAVAKFLDMTMAGYNERFSGDYGKAVPGIFTDEPNFLLRRVEDLGTTAWTRRLPELFRERFDYDLIDNLAALAFCTDGFQKVRHDYGRLVAERFVEAFSKPYGRMCDRLGLKLTGHWLGEDTFNEQVTQIGAAMPHYEYEQVPGIDHLRRNIEDALTLKQCSSVAHQFGRQQVMCEIFGVSGQDFTFEDAKWIGDFHFALGVNYFCPHLTLYSFTGDRKRDYPPTFSYHQPYWDKMHLANDYFARAGVLTRTGYHQTRILLLHPISSAWSFYSGFKEHPEVQHYDDQLTSLQDELLAQHLDFDYGDEIILSRHGKIEDGQLRVASHGQYDVVVVPPSFTWASETVQLLESFADAGGRVIFAGQRPTAIDGSPDQHRWSALLARETVRQCEKIEASLANYRDVSVCNAAGEQIGKILYHHRRDGDRHIYFFCNTDRDKTYDARITLSTPGSVTCCDLATGETRPMSAENVNGQCVLEHHFAPAGSLALAVEPQLCVVDPQPVPREKDRQLINGDWQFERSHPNTLVLDVCRWSLNNGPLCEPQPVWKVRHAAFDAAGLERYRGIQPWVLTERGISPTESARVEMHFEFQSDLDRPTAFLVVEKAENFRITFNDKEVSGDVSEWHWDKRFRKIDVGALIRKGNNEIILATEYKLGVEIEDIFIVGDFATRKISETQYALTPEPTTLKTGNFCDQGYHFYAGNMVYRKHIRCHKEDSQRLHLQLNKPVGTLFEARVNGQLAGPIAWQPWEIDITDLVNEGNNTIEIIVYGSLRNAFGPLHNSQYQKKGNNWWIGPESFTDEKCWTDAYMLEPYGLLEGAALVLFEA